MRDERWQDPLTRLELSVSPLDEQPEGPTVLEDKQWCCMRQGTSHQLRDELWLNTVSIPLVCAGLRFTRTTPVEPLSCPGISRVKPLFVAWTISMDSIVLAVLATGAEIAKWPKDFGLSAISQLLDSLMKPLCAGRSIRLWINLDTPPPDHLTSLSRNIARALIRGRSQQLQSRLWSFRNFPGFSAVWTCKPDSLMLQPCHHPEILEF